MGNIDKWLCAYRNFEYGQSTLPSSHDQLVRQCTNGCNRLLTNGRDDKPDKTARTRELTGMQGHFGPDFTLAKKGKYGVMCKFKLQDGKVRTSKFWYEIK